MINFRWNSPTGIFLLRSVENYMKGILEISWVFYITGSCHSNCQNRYYTSIMDEKIKIPRKEGFVLHRKQKFNLHFQISNSEIAYAS